MEKKKYLAPDAKIVLIGPELMQGTEVITTSPTGADQEAKVAPEFEEEEVSLPVDKNIWAEDEE